MKEERLYIGEKVKQIRLNSKLNQGEFSDKLGLNQVRLCYIEGNKRKLTLPVLISFSKYLGKSLDETLKELTTKRKGKTK
jgi:transcriptional regulator with XRE-family HTH domain